MEGLHEADLGLILTVGPNAAIGYVAFVAARRLTPSREPSQRLLDSLLWWAALAGGLVLLLGSIGQLHLPGLLVVVLLLTVAVVALDRLRRPPGDERIEGAADREVRFACILALFVACLVLAAAYLSRILPSLTTDALVYHLAFPARWVQQERIELIPVWFHNPANTFSPLHPSCVFAWWILPMGSDVLARFAQLPFLAALGLAIYRLLRGAGTAAFLAAAAASACCVSRPFLGEGLQAKDDVMLAACFVASVVALTREDVASLAGGLRLGLAFGLLLATKYVALLSVPMLLVPALGLVGRKPGRRQILWALVPLILLAGPWYVPNLVLTGNPLFPIEVRLGSWTLLPGLFATAVAPADRTLSSLVDTFVIKGRFGLPGWLATLLAIGWLAALVTCRRRWRAPGILACLLGPPILLGTFFFASPDREIRYVFPLLCLLFAATGLAIAHAPLPRAAKNILGGGLLLASLSRGLVWPILIESALYGMLLAAGLVLARLAWKRAIAPRPEVRMVVLPLVGFAVIAIFYVGWGNFVEDCRWARGPLYAVSYEDRGLGPAWAWIEKNARPGDTIAYTGTPMCYPLMGFHYRRRAVYLPIQPGAERIRDLPPVPERLTGRTLLPKVVALYRGNPDRAFWLEQVRRARPRYLLTTPFREQPVVEAAWAEAEPSFRRVFQSGPTRVFALLPAKQ